MITTSIKVVGELEFDGMASTRKLLINAVKANKPKVLTGLNQHARKRASYQRGAIPYFLWE